MNGNVERRTYQSSAVVEQVISVALFSRSVVIIITIFSLLFINVGFYRF